MNWRIETLGPAHVGAAMKMALDEGWNPGLADAHTFHDADPDAFMGCVDAEDRLLACISIARYGPKHGFLGFYICAPDWRGCGIGWALWQAALARVGRIGIALDGVVAQQEKYRRSGFAYAHANLRYGGTPGPLADTAHVCPLAECDPIRLAAYDTDLFGLSRPRFLGAWLAQQGATGVCLLDEGIIRGYGLSRPCHDGTKIGPLFAEDDAAARILFTALTRDISGPVFLDAPATNAAAGRMAREAGLSPVFETARMIRGDYPAIDPCRTYGITSFEFG